MKKLTLLSVVAGMLLLGAGAAVAGPPVAVLDVQKILDQSDSAKAAKAKVEAKFKELQAGFKGEEDAMLAMQQEFEKKNSVWSDEVKEEKAREFQKKRRELQAKNEDARLELKKVEEKEMGPVVKALRETVVEMGKTKGYGVVMDSRAGVWYHDDSVDISNEVIKAFNAKGVPASTTPAAKAPAKAPAKK
ncbi:MAG: hypothetical protein BWK76_07995 [Desulfobulbaceae bacterium A2]|nr:MAG: hypothetical protein BWK76_07995 [Desulfobulbaceae bacterium A2]